MKSIEAVESSSVKVALVRPAPVHREVAGRVLAQAATDSVKVSDEASRFAGRMRELAEMSTERNGKRVAELKAAVAAGMYPPMAVVEGFQRLVGIEAN